MKFLLSFRRNWGLKLISLLFAVLLWNYVIVEVNPRRTVSYNNIVMEQPHGFPQLKSTGLTVEGDLSGYLKNVSVSIELPRNEVQLLKQSDIRVWIDLSGITQEGKQNVKVTAESPRGTIKGITPETISVTVEKIAKRDVPVSFETTGELPAGYWAGIAQVTPSLLQISGAVSDVEKVDKAVVRVSLDNLTKDFSSAVDFILLDRNAGTVSAAGLESNPTNCIVSLPVFPTKAVPVDAGMSLNGSAAKGYEVLGVSVSPGSIEIAGPAGMLAGISSLIPGRTEIDGAKGSFSKIQAVELPSGTYAVAGTSVTVTIRIGLKMTTSTMSDLPIEFTGLTSGLKPDKAYYGSVTFSCPELSVPGLDSSRMHLKADAAGLGAGAQALSVTASYDDPEAGVVDIVPNPAQITVKIVSAAP